MRSTRENVIAQLTTYIGSFTPENKHLGPSNEKQLLDQLTYDYKQLSEDDQTSVNQYFKTLRNQALTPEENQLLQNAKNNLVIGAAIGAISGALGGAVAGGHVSHYLSAGRFVNSACKAGGALLGSGLGAAGLSFFNSTMGSRADKMEITRKLRPFQLVKSALGSEILNIDTMRCLLKTSEDSAQKLEPGLRQRRNGR